MEDPIDTAQAALDRVAGIAIGLGCKHDRPLCAELGFELWLVSDHLKAATLEQRQQVRPRISKLLREVERICSVSYQSHLLGVERNWDVIMVVTESTCRSAPTSLTSKLKWPAQGNTKKTHPMMSGILHEMPDSTEYKKIKSRIERGILNITAGGGEHARRAMKLLKSFAGREKKRESQLEQLSIVKENPMDFPSHIHSSIRKTLQEHMCCTCGKGVTPGKHLAELLLQPPAQLETDSFQAEFDMLFSSRPSYNECFSGRWQDIHLEVPRSDPRQL